MADSKDMQNYDTRGGSLTQGHNCVVRVDLSDPNGSNPVEIGMVENGDWTANVETAKANVIGCFTSASIDAVGISANASLTGFIPTKNALKGFEDMRGGGKFSIKSFKPSNTRLIDSKLVTKIPYMDFYDKDSQAVVSFVVHCVPTRYHEAVQGRGYVKADINFECILMENGADFESEI